VWRAAAEAGLPTAIEPRALVWYLAVTEWIVLSTPQIHLEILITFSLYPEPLFGGVLRLALFTVLPAGFVGYLPVRVVHAPSVPLVCLLVLGASAYLGLAALMFERGLRRYASGSRFSTSG
jgi:ABC-type uncharacterized transport system permease subunit